MIHNYNFSIIIYNKNKIWQLYKFMYEHINLRKYICIMRCRMNWWLCKMYKIYGSWFGGGIEIDNYKDYTVRQRIFLS